MSNSEDDDNISSYTPNYSICSPAYPRPHIRQEEEPPSDQEVERPDTPPPEPLGEVIFVPVAWIIMQNQARREQARRLPRRRQPNRQQQQPVIRVLCSRTIVREETLPRTVSPTPIQRREETWAERFVLINRTQQ